MHAISVRMQYACAHLVYLCFDQKTTTSFHGHVIRGNVPAKKQAGGRPSAEDEEDHEIDPQVNIHALDL
jgi:hypothetical protein